MIELPLFLKVVGELDCLVHKEPNATNTNKESYDVSKHTYNIYIREVKQKMSVFPDCQPLSLWVCDVAYCCSAIICL